MAKSFKERLAELRGETPTETSTPKQTESTSTKTSSTTSTGSSFKERLAKLNEQQQAIQTPEPESFRAIGGTYVKNANGGYSKVTDDWRVSEKDLASLSKTGHETLGTDLRQMVTGTVNRQGANYLSALNTLDLGLNAIKSGDDHYQPETGSALWRTLQAGNALTSNATNQLSSSKEGRGWIGSTLMDVGSSAIDVAIDSALSALVPGAGMAAMSVRSFGGSAQESREKGKSITTQFINGIKSAAIEYLTEKMWTIGGRKGIEGTGWIERMTSKFGDELIAKGMPAVIEKMVTAFGSEAVEEMLSDVLNPIADKWISAISQRLGGDYEESEWPSLAEVLYDGLVGGIVGLGGGMTEGIKVQKEIEESGGRQNWITVQRAQREIESQKLAIDAIQDELKTKNGKKKFGKVFKTELFSYFSPVYGTKVANQMANDFIKSFNELKAEDLKDPATAIGKIADKYSEIKLEREFAEQEARGARYIDLDKTEAENDELTQELNSVLPEDELSRISAQEAAQTEEATAPFGEPTEEETSGPPRNAVDFIQRDNEEQTQIKEKYPDLWQNILKVFNRPANSPESLQAKNEELESIVARIREYNKATAENEQVLADKELKLLNDILSGSKYRHVKNKQVRQKSFSLPVDERKEQILSYLQERADISDKELVYSEKNGKLRITFKPKTTGNPIIDAQQYAKAQNNLNEEETNGTQEVHGAYPGREDGGVRSGGERSENGENNRDAGDNSAEHARESTETEGKSEYDEQAEARRERIRRSQKLTPRSAEAVKLNIAKRFGKFEGSEVNKEKAASRLQYAKDVLRKAGMAEEHVVSLADKLLSQNRKDVYNYLTGNQITALPEEEQTDYYRGLVVDELLASISEGNLPTVVTEMRRLGIAEENIETMLDSARELLQEDFMYSKENVNESDRRGNYNPSAEVSSYLASKNTVGKDRKVVDVNEENPYAGDADSIRFDRVKYVPQEGDIELESVSTGHFADSGKSLMARPENKIKVIERNADTYLVVDSDGYLVGKRSSAHDAYILARGESPYYYEASIDIGNAFGSNFDGKLILKTDRVYNREAWERSMLNVDDKDDVKYTAMMRSHGSDIEGVGYNIYSNAEATTSTLVIRMDRNHPKASEDLAKYVLRKTARGEGIVAENGKRYFFGGMTVSQSQDAEFRLYDEKTFKKLQANQNAFMKDGEINGTEVVLTKYLANQGFLWTPSNNDTGVKISEVVILPDWKTILYDVNQNFKVENMEADELRLISMYEKTYKRKGFKPDEAHRLAVEKAKEILRNAQVNDAVKITTDIEMNVTDGAGFIWADNQHGFQFRGPGGVKGNAIGFDWYRAFMDLVPEGAVSKYIKKENGKLYARDIFSEKDGKWVPLAGKRALLFESTFKFAEQYKSMENGRDEFYSRLGEEDIRSIPKSNVYGKGTKTGMVKGMEKAGLAQMFRNIQGFTPMMAEELVDSYLMRLEEEIIQNPEAQAQMLGKDLKSINLNNSSFGASLLAYLGEDALYTAMGRGIVRDKFVDMAQDLRGSKLYIENQNTANQWIAPDVIGLVGKMIDINDLGYAGLSSNEIYSNKITEGLTFIGRNPSAEENDIQLVQNKKGGYEAFAEKYNLDTDYVFVNIADDLGMHLDNDFDGDTVRLVQGLVTRMLEQVRAESGKDYNVFTQFSHNNLSAESKARFSVEGIEAVIKKTLDADAVGIYDNSLTLLSSISNEQLKKGLELLAKKGKKYASVDALRRDLQATFSVAYKLAFDFAKYGWFPTEYKAAVNDCKELLDNIIEANGYNFTYVDEEGKETTDKSKARRRNGKPERAKNASQPTPISNAFASNARKNALYNTVLRAEMLAQEANKEKMERADADVREAYDHIKELREMILTQNKIPAYLSDWYFSTEDVTEEKSYRGTQYTPFDYENDPLGKRLVDAMNHYMKAKKYYNDLYNETYQNSNILSKGDDLASMLARAINIPEFRQETERKLEEASEGRNRVFPLQDIASNGPNKAIALSQIDADGVKPFSPANRKNLTHVINSLANSFYYHKDHGRGENSKRAARLLYSYQRALGMNNQEFTEFYLYTMGASTDITNMMTFFDLNQNSIDPNNKEMPTSAIVKRNMNLMGVVRQFEEVLSRRDTIGKQIQAVKDEIAKINKDTSKVNLMDLLSLKTLQKEMDALDLEIFQKGREKETLQANYDLLNKQFAGEGAFDEEATEDIEQTLNNMRIQLEKVDGILKNLDAEFETKQAAFDKLSEDIGDLSKVALDNIHDITELEKNLREVQKFIDKYYVVYEDATTKRKQLFEKTEPASTIFENFRNSPLGDAAVLKKFYEIASDYRDGIDATATTVEDKFKVLLKPSTTSNETTAEETSSVEAEPVAEEKQETDKQKNWKKANNMFRSYHGNISEDTLGLAKLKTEYHGAEDEHIKEIADAYDGFVKAAVDINNGNVENFTGVIKAYDKLKGTLYYNDLVAERLAQAQENLTRHEENMARPVTERDNRNYKSAYIQAYDNALKAMRADVENVNRAIKNTKRFGKEMPKKSKPMGKFLSGAIRWQATTPNMWKFFAGYKRESSGKKTFGYEMADRITQATTANMALISRANAYYDSLKSKKGYDDFFRGNTKIADLTKDAAIREKFGDLSALEVAYAVTVLNQMELAKEYSRYDIETPYYNNNWVKGFVTKDGRAYDIDLKTELPSLKSALESNGVIKDYLKATEQLQLAFGEAGSKVFMKHYGFVPTFFARGKFLPANWAELDETGKPKPTENLDSWDMEKHIKHDPTYTMGRGSEYNGYLKIVPMTEAVDSYAVKMADFIAYKGLRADLLAMNRKSRANDSLADIAGNTMGAEFGKWVNNFVDDITTTKNTDSILRNIRINLQKGALIGNPSTIAKQSSSYWSAAGILSMRALMAARLTRYTGSKTGALTDTIRYRRFTNSLDPTVAEILEKDNSLVERVMSKIPGYEAMKKGISWMDAITVNNLFTATVYDVLSEYPKGTKFDPKSDEFRALAEKVEDKFNEVVIYTQPMFDQMLRAEYARTDKEAVRMLSMFRTQQTQNLNRLMTTIGEYQAAKKAGEDTTEYAKAVRGTVAGQATAALSLGILSVMADLVKHKFKKYRDDDDEMSAEKIIERIALNAFEGGAGTVWFGDEVAKVLVDSLSGGEYSDSYGISMGAISTINNAIDAIKSFAKEPTVSSARYAAGYISQLFGIPLNNAYSYLNSAMMFAADALGENQYHYDDIIRLAEKDSKVTKEMKPAVTALMEQGMTKKEANRYASGLDVNFNGKISQEEIEEMYYTDPESAGRLQVIWDAQGWSKKFSDMTTAQDKKRTYNSNPLYKAMDADESGSVSKQELTDYYLEHPDEKDEIEKIYDERGFNGSFRSAIKSVENAQKKETAEQAFEDGDYNLLFNTISSMKSGKSVLTNLIRDETDDDETPSTNLLLNYLSSTNVDDTTFDTAVESFGGSKLIKQYKKLRASGLPPRLAVQRIDDFDADDNGSITQAELAEYYKANRADEAIIAEFWSACGWSKTWAEYKKSKKIA